MFDYGVLTLYTQLIFLLIGTNILQIGIKQFKYLYLFSQYCYAQDIKIDSSPQKSKLFKNRHD